MASASSPDSTPDPDPVPPADPGACAGHEAGSGVGPVPGAMPASALQASPVEPFLIVGVTTAGRAFRPSDWADRLAGVMSGFQPPGSAPRTRLQYSPYAVPGVHGAYKCVRIDPAIARVEPLALSFLLNFARDNDLQVVVTSRTA